MTLTAQKHERSYNFVTFLFKNQHLPEFFSFLKFNVIETNQYEYKVDILFMFLIPVFNHKEVIIIYITI